MSAPLQNVQGDGGSAETVDLIEQGAANSILSHFGGKRGETYQLGRARDDVWRALEWIAFNPKIRARTRLRALELFAKRTDPEPAKIQQQITAHVEGPVLISWASPGALPSPTPLALSSPASTMPSSANGPARPSSSSTDVLESL